MEFMDNGDLSGLLKAHKTLEKPIEEERLFDIFIKAMKCLSYIHSKKIVHRNIKLKNLFLNVDGEIKLGDFCMSAAFIDKKENNNNIENFNENENNSIKESVIGDVICEQTIIGTPICMSPEMMNQTKYDLKTDVYSMGVSFFELCFWNPPRDLRRYHGNIIHIDLPIQYNKNIYSQELIDIINKMKEIDKNKRPDSDTVLKMLIEEFNKKYSKNSSLGATLSCLYAFDGMTEYFKKPNNQKFLNDNKINKPISFAYLYGINVINNKYDWYNSLFDIRNVINFENNRYSGNKEIETSEILSHLLAKMHKELNQLSNNNYYRKKTSDLESQIKEDALKKFINISNATNKSAIYDFFYAIMKTKTTCSKCSLTKYYFNFYYYISFEINLAMRYKKGNLSLENLFDIQNDICIPIGLNKFRYCEQCKSGQVHCQRKQFYCFPNFLIICLERGNNCQNKMKIIYDLKLNLEKKCDCVGNNNYQLVGIVKRMDKNKKEHYISLYYDYAIKSWILRDDSSSTKINSPLEHNQGIEIAFFYKKE